MRDRPADFDVTEWGRRAAREIIEHHAEAAAIDTANYRECGFIIAAARLALSDPDLAARIGQIMEPPRPGVDA